ncbi:MAG TPA: tRNA pseudouridine(55) synthase TruB [Bacilli bacterium]|nr:tRNA pseudouridine(55) synthase TruB [Bacilli bacterium]
MNGIIIVNKEKDMTSRDVVNIVSKKLNTKKVGHGGTLDPIATGVLVLGVGKYTKLLDMIISHEKEYIAEVLVGECTDTLDITGNILSTSDEMVNRNSLEHVISSYKKKYLQEIPLYSAKKLNGKKLYQYARENIDIELPKKEVEIIDIKLLDIYEKDRKQYFKFYTKVSKGTFIRSLIKDISNDLAIQMTMSGLVRVSQGPFKLDDCNNLNDNFRLLQAHEIFDYKVVELGQELYKKVINGNKAILPITDDKIIFSSGGNDVAIYELNNNMYQPLIMLK